MEYKRRHLLTTPGEDLLLTRNANDCIFHFMEWQRISGMTPEQFTWDPLCRVPLPVYTSIPAGVRRFSEVNPELMWHPVFWLPASLAQDLHLPGINATDSLAIRSIRLALELSISGLYDTNDGWLDILSTVGLDSDDDVDIARVADWQAGARDELLDSIDLTSYLFRDQDPNWALTSAAALLKDVRQAQWALLADSLFDVMDTESYPGDNEVDVEDLRAAVAQNASIAAGVLHNVVGPEGVAPEDFWSYLHDAVTDPRLTTVDDLLAGPVASGLDWLSHVRETYWPSLELVATTLRPEHA